jgi:hypothetical protein
MKRGLSYVVAVAIASAICGAASAWAHGGGLNAAGCHNDRKGGTGYHCHRGSSSSSSSEQRSRPAPLLSGSGSGAFPNCAAARAAVAAPVRLDDEGYGRHLDRDGDGVGCE